MKNKKINPILIFLLLLFFTVLISTVSAEDTEYTNNIYVDANVEAGGDGRLDSPYKDLKTAIENSDEDTNIILREGVYTGLDNFNLTLSQNKIKIVNYENENVVIAPSGSQGYTPFIHILGDDVILEGLTIKDIKDTATSSNGGAIIWSGENAIIDNCLFENIHVGNINGVAVFFEKGNAIVKNSVFLNNSISNMGTPVGGIITFNGTNNKVFNTRFDSSIGGKGSISSQKGGLYVENCNFTNEKRYYTQDASGIYALGENNIINSSSFIGLNAGLRAGAIWGVNGSFIIDNCEFINNTGANMRGGGILLENSTFTISNSNFTRQSSPQGGAIAVVDSKGTIDHCIFDKNIGNNYGGSIYLYNGEYNVTNSNFTNGVGYNYGGFIYSDSNNTLIKNCSFENIRVPSGGAIYSRGDNATIEDVYIKNCTAYSFGGAIESVGNNAVIRNFNITDCGNSTYQNNYGVVTIRGNNTIVEDGSFNNIYSMNYGGSIGWYGNNGTLRNVTIENSHVTTSDGGAIFWVGNEGTVDNCTFLNCTANANSGSISWLTSNSTISNCVFINSSCGNSAFITARGEGNKIVNSSFTNGNSMNYGAVLMSGNNNLVDNCNFTNINNTLSSAGGITMSGNSISISNCNFENINGTTGGAISFSGTGNITNNNFNNVQSLYTGGAIEFRGTGNITDNNITNAHTTYLGGGIDFTGTGLIANNSFINCSVNQTGGAIYNSANSFLTVTNNEMENCTAGIAGDDIYNMGTIGKLNFIVNKNVVYTIINRTTFVAVKLTDDTGDEVVVPSLNCRIHDDTSNYTRDYTFTTNDDNVTGFYVNFDTPGTYVFSPETNGSNIIFNELNRLTIIVDDYLPVKVNIHNINTHIEATRDIIIDVLDYNNDKVVNGTLTMSFKGETYSSNVTNGRVVFEDIYLGDDAGYYPITANYTSLHDFYYDSEGEGYVRLGLYPSSIHGENIRGVGDEVKSAVFYVYGEHGEIHNAIIEMTLPNGTVYNIRSGSPINITLPDESGRYPVSLEYEGDDEHYGAKSTIYLIVDLDETNITNAEINSYPGDKVNVTFYIVDEFNQPVSNGSTDFILNNKTYNETVTNGTVTFEIDLPDTEGFYQINVTYDGNGHYDHSYSTLTLNLTKIGTELSVEDITEYDGEVIPILIELKDENGEPINTTVNISLPTGEIISIPTNTETNISSLKPGNYQIPVSYPGSTKYKPANTTFNLEVKEKENVTIITPNNLTFNKTTEFTNITINLTNKEDPVTNGTLTLTIGNKTYTANVKDGIAEFIDVELPNTTGQYTYTLNYIGEGIYNNATALLTINIIDTPDKKNNTPKKDKDKDKGNSNNGGKDTNLSGIPTGNPIILLLLALACLIMPYKKK